MSRRGSAPAPGPGEQVVEQKQRNNVYTMMLILAFVAICVACTLLWLELQYYGPYPWWKTDGVAPVTAWLPALADVLPSAGRA